ncbi:MULTISPECIES: S8 family serine peptidase [Spirosoma]|uniref:S8 family serine peptidase n=1 Tax=Spirosoma TaxID=107 RepID=UPI0013EC9A53|nr:MULTISPECIES: S8 family serine peptidase [Spirosoma]
MFTLLFLCFSLGGQAQDSSKEYVDGEVYVKLKSVSSVQRKGSNAVNIQAELPFIAQLSTQFAVDRAERSFFFSTNADLQRVYRLKLANHKLVEKFMDEIKARPDIEYVERVPLMRTSLTPNDPSLNSQYHLSTIKAYQAWDLNQGYATIKVAICDDAVQITHPDLAANMLSGYDVADGDNNPNPPNTSMSHGTHVAGIVGAVTGNGVGVASMGFNNIKLIPVKSSTDASAGSNAITHAYEGVAWAAQNGANIINTSWGGGAYSSTAQTLANDVFSRGIIWIAAAGNSNTSSVSYPAAYNNIISVGSSTSTDARSSFSNYGPWVDLFAPGSSIYSTVPTSTYATYSGTSMASPLVASLFGYIWSVKPALTSSELITLIKNTCDNIDAQNPGFSGLLGSGRINALRAVQQACISSSTVSITPSGNPVLCAGTPLTLRATSLTGTQSYQWTRDGQPTGPDAATLAVTQTGVYGLTVQGTQGCPVSASAVNVTFIPASLSVTTSKRPLLCQTDSVELSIPVTYAGTVLWYRNGLVASTNRSRLMVNQGGDYSVSLEAAGLSCTAVSPVISVTQVVVDPNLSASGSTTLCPGQQTTLSLVPVAGATYQWQRDNASLAISTPTLTVAESGVYSASINTGNCVIPSTRKLVLQLPGALQISTTRPPGICSGDSTILQAIAVDASAAVRSSLPYTWSRDGQVITGIHSASLASRITGTYTVSVIFPGCQIEATPVSTTVVAHTVTIGSSMTVGCTGGQIMLSTNTLPPASYQWLRNGAVVSGAVSSTLGATQAGTYQARATIQNCLFTSNQLPLQFLDVRSPLPAASSLTLCGLDPARPSTTSLTAAATACPTSITQTATYSGGVVGYDGRLKSGNDPTVQISGLAQLSRIAVSITWEKKDGNYETSCGLPAGSGNPFNEEVQFQLQSPQGTIITLVPARTYGLNTAYAGSITTVFQDGAPAIVFGSTPRSGTFSPAQSLSILTGQNPNGVWTLLPLDDYSLDPLCVSGFSVTVETVGSVPPATLTWWSAPASGTLLETGSSYSPPLSTTASQTVYVQSQCMGYCPSNRVAVTLSRDAMRTVQSGTWSNPATWSCNRLPTINDVVFLDNGHIVSVDQLSQWARQLVYRGGTLQFVATKGSVSFPAAN